MCENFAEREYKKKFLEAFRRKYGKNAKFSMGYMCIFAVTPLAGVGIEIASNPAAPMALPFVTPLAGVGIEISCVTLLFSLMSRHPPRGGGN